MKLYNIFIFFLTILELQLYFVDSYGFPVKKSCQYFRNGYVYRGPCKSKLKSKKPYDKYKEYGSEVSLCKTTEGIDGLCRPPAYCFSQYDDIEQYIYNRCKLVNGLTGICCPNIIRLPSVTYVPIKIPIPFDPVVKIDINNEIIAKVAEESRKIVRKQFNIEKELIRAGFFQRSHTMESFHQAFFGPDDPEIRRVSKDGLFALETTLQLAKRFRLTPIQARDGLRKFTLWPTRLSNHCPKIPNCNKKSKYRTIDGSCNNLDNPLWGKSLTQFLRLLPPAYADGLNEFRRSIDGGLLPGAREVSCKAAIDHELPDKKFTLFVMQWGQFIDHDLTLTASTRAQTGEGLHCCDDEARRKTKIVHPACRPIIVPIDDPFYSRFNHRCNNFVRNAAGPRYGCNLGFREQINTLTQIIDGSMVYGSTDERAHHLRSFKNGRLRISTVNNVEFLPFDTENRSDECAIPANRNLRCFVGGDVRVNEQTGLTMAHLLLLREHNKIAAILQKLNPGWNDEFIYQETRRIVAAEIQTITYNEWLPLIIGRSVMEKFQLLVKPDGYTYDYDPYLNPGVLNEFATAVYRFHTLIQGFIKLMNNRGQVTETLVLRNLFNNPTTMYRKGAYDEFLNGYTAHPTQTFDQFFSQELTNHLFQEENSEFGMDLIALNIQRGRDHGLNGYNDFREVCGLPRIQSFEELAEVLRPGSAEIMAKLYRYVDDIDLFIAGNHEKPLKDAVVGPIFACILAEQSRRNKLGDRFWFENGNMPHSFREDQLVEIRKVSLASIICDNNDRIESMQPLAFLQPAEWNPRIDCANIARPNFKLWKNEKVW